MSTNRTAYTSGHFLFTIDGELDTSWLKSVDGGAVKGTVVEESLGLDDLQLKHIATVETDPLTVEVGISASSSVLRWVRDSMNRKFSRRNGSVIHANFKYESVFEQSFSDALLSEITFPALDGSDKSAAYLTLKVQPERITLEKGKGEKVLGKEGESKQKLWAPSNFRLSIDGIDCTRVSKIDSFTIKQKIKTLYLGDSRHPELEPTGIEIPGLTVTMALAYAEDFIKWHREFVIEGGKDPEYQKTGAIEFLDPQTNQVLFTITLESVGIKSLTIEKSEAAAESIKRCKVELFVETMKIDPSGAGFA